MTGTPIKPGGKENAITPANGCGPTGTGSACDSHGEGGSITVSANGEQTWLGHRMFWFAWATFNPSTLLRSGR